jgi:hypothetical protein
LIFIEKNKKKTITVVADAWPADLDEVGPVATDGVLGHVHHQPFGSGIENIFFKSIK